MTFDDLLEYAQKVFAYNQKHEQKIALFSDADTNTRVTLEYMFQNLIKSEIGDFDEARKEEISEKKTEDWIFYLVIFLIGLSPKNSPRLDVDAVLGIHRYFSFLPFPDCLAT
ncbi:MAG: hypothetical protein GY950_27715 [bacterium]|nr:hypothetical protein [bacterium]